MALNVARGGQQPPAPAALRLVDAGRMTVQADLWRRPLPPALWKRLEQKRRREHERLVDRYQQLGVETATLAGKVELQREADEVALRHAVGAGKPAPQAQTPALELELEERRRETEAAGRMVVESGSKLVGTLAGDDLVAAIDDAQTEARTILERLPELAAGIAAELQRVAELTGEAEWTAVLEHRRRQGPYRGKTAGFGSQRLSQAAEASARLQEMIGAELAEQDWRSAPRQHNPPRGFQIPEGHRFTTGTGPAADFQAGE